MSLEIHNLTTMSLGTIYALLGLLLFFKARAHGCGWLFPIAAFIIVAGTINFVQALSLSTPIPKEIIPHEMFKISFSVLSDIMILAGFGLSLLRIRMGVVTNSYLTWGWLLVVITLGAIYIMWMIGSQHFEDGVLAALEGGSPQPLMDTGLVLLLIVVLLSLGYASSVLFLTFFLIYSASILIKMVAWPNLEISLIRSMYFNIAAAAWLYFWVIQEVGVDKGVMLFVRHDRQSNRNAGNQR